MAAAFERAFARFLNDLPQVVAVHDLATKWRIELVGGYLLDIYHNEALAKYSYTLVLGDRRVIGWDNAPHHAEVPNFPHHVHHPDGRIEPSSMNGDPQHDLHILRHELAAYFDA